MESLNFCVGKNAGLYLTTGHHNILIGDEAGKDFTDESYIFIIAGITYKIKDDLEYEKILINIKNMIMMFADNNDNGNTSIGYWSRFVNTIGCAGTKIGIKNCDCEQPCNENTCIGRRVI